MSVMLSGCFEIMRAAHVHVLHVRGGFRGEGLDWCRTRMNPPPLFRMTPYFATDL